MYSLDLMCFTFKLLKLNTNFLRYCMHHFSLIIQEKKKKKTTTERNKCRVIRYCCEVPEFNSGKIKFLQKAQMEVRITG